MSVSTYLALLVSFAVVALWYCAYWLVRIHQLLQRTLKPTAIGVTKRPP